MKKNTSGWNKFLIVISFIIFLIGSHITIDNLVYKGYEYPIYISEEIYVENNFNGTYNIRGKFKNLTNSIVKVDKIKIYLSATERLSYKKYKTIYDYKYIEDVTIQPFDEYEIFLTTYYPLQPLAKITEIYINGKECKIQFSSDGVTFSGPAPIAMGLSFLAVGLIAIVVNVYFLINNRIRLKQINF